MKSHWSSTQLAQNLAVFGGVLALAGLVINVLAGNSPVAAAFGVGFAMIAWLFIEVRTSSARQEDARQARAQQTYRRRAEMRDEIVPLSEIGATPDDILICLGCGQLVLSGQLNQYRHWKDLHISSHAWKMATNPYGYLDVTGLRPAADFPPRPHPERET